MYIKPTRILPKNFCNLSLTLTEILWVVLGKLVKVLITVTGKTAVKTQMRVINTSMKMLIAPKGLVAFVRKQAFISSVQFMKALAH